MKQKGEVEEMYGIFSNTKKFSCKSKELYTRKSEKIASRSTYTHNRHSAFILHLVVEKFHMYSSVRVSTAVNLQHCIFLSPVFLLLFSGNFLELRFNSLG